MASCIDGKDKEFEDSSYAKVKTLLKTIQRCSYFDTTAPKQAIDNDNAIKAAAASIHSEATATSVNADNELQQMEQQSDTTNFGEVEHSQSVPAANVVTVPTFPHEPNSNATAILLPPAQSPSMLSTAVPSQQLHSGNLQATTVRAVEQGFFKHHQYLQQMRPVTEVIAGSNFFFLQVN